MQSINTYWWLGIWPLINILLIVTLYGMLIYGFILFVKFAKRGIEAFDIYIKKNKE